MIKLFLIFLAGFALGVAYTRYLEPEINLDFINSPSGSREVLIIHGFSSCEISKPLKNIKLFITKPGYADSVLSCMELPRANKTYKINLDTSIFVNDNNYYWTMMFSGVKHMFNTAGPMSLDPLRISDGGIVGYVYVVSQKAYINKDNSVTHSVELMNDNSHPVDAMVRVSYFSKNDMVIWDSTLQVDRAVPPETQQKYTFTFRTNKLDRSEKSSISVAEVIHLR